MLSGTFFVACQKDKAVVPAQVQSATSRGANLEANPSSIDEALLNAMAANAGVQEFILDTYAVAVEYDQALAAMSPDARNAYFATYGTHGNPYLVRTQAQMTALFESQNEHRAKMFDDFPGYLQMEADKQSAFDAQLFGMVTAGYNEEHGLKAAGGTCTEAYWRCLSKYCDSNIGPCGDACWDNYIYCLNSRY
ncbi:hypothetical protein [Hymenobacter jeollabukensis]|uniref:Uncharacterized protein n=1 Tax=Hymenobacter jeollabukensis TaxID=2025313 RepID=A0A5R8WVZ4_9BACT|nr:hypothetical protein [Hymenobacter jeollabukensis]TLM95605.1 hypothetical protein FDY95_07420 [Hymenobacter jeollabukensis]